MRGRDYDGEQTGCDARAGRRRHMCDVLRCGAGSIWLPAAALAARGAVFFHVELERHRLVRHPDGGRERVKIPLWRHQLRRRGRGSGRGPGRRVGRPAGAEGEGRRREGRGREKARGQGNRRGAGPGKDGQQRRAGLLEGLPQRRLGAVHAQGQGEKRRRVCGLHELKRPEGAGAIVERGCHRGARGAGLGVYERGGHGKRRLRRAGQRDIGLLHRRRRSGRLLRARLREHRERGLFELCVRAPRVRGDVGGQLRADERGGQGGGHDGLRRHGAPVRGQVAGHARRGAPARKDRHVHAAG